MKFHHIGYLVKNLNRYMKLSNLDKKDLKTLFVLWGKYIPQHKQSINCGSCQNAVYNFWHRVNDHWSE